MSLTPHRDTIISLLTELARDQPDLPLYTFLDSDLQVSAVLASGDLLQRARQIAGLLQARGVSAEPVMVLSPHGPAFMEALFGVLLAGCAPVPVTCHRTLGMADIPNIIASTGLRVVVGQQATLEKLRSGRFTAHTPVNHPHRDLVYIPTGELPQADWRPPPIVDTDAALVYPGLRNDEPDTPMVLSHRQLLESLDGLIRALAINHTDRLLTSVDLADGMALVLHILLPVRAGLQSFFIPVQYALDDVLAWLRAVTAHACSIISAPPALLSLAANKVCHSCATKIDLSALRFFCVGGDQVAPAMVSFFVERYSGNDMSSDKIFACYGLSATCRYLSGRRGYQSRSLHGVACLALGPPDTNLLQTSATGDRLLIVDNELYCRGRECHLFSVGGVEFQAEDIESVVLQAYCARGLSRCVVLHTNASRLTVLLAECATWQLANDWRGVVQAIMDAVLAKTGCQLDRVILLRPDSLPMSVSGIVLRRRCAVALADGALMLRLLPVRGK